MVAVILNTSISIMPYKFFWHPRAVKNDIIAHKKGM
jgi:hypothetical protein